MHCLNTEQGGWILGRSDDKGLHKYIQEVVLPKIKERRKYTLLVDHDPLKKCSICIIVQQYFPRVKIESYSFTRAILGEE